MRRLWINTGDLLNRKLIERKMPKIELARSLEVNENTIYGYCNGQYPPEPTRLKAIQTILDISDEETIQALVADHAQVLKDELQRRIPWRKFEEVKINAEIS